MYDGTDYRVGLGIDFEIHVRETLNSFCTPIGDVKSRTERKEDYRRMRVTPDLLFETNGFRFYVDCHYRTSMPYAYVELDYSGVYRLKERCYENLEHPVFVAYGIGGDPYHPDWMVFEPKENLHTRRMTKSRFLKLDRKLSTLSYYNVIYQYRMRQAGFGEARTWDAGRKERVSA
ncbi:MAG: hypothetical protein IKQ93_06740 [Candidatus Methanomethylophilaceae archaeon]|nr:hypothetical protein [Candidatus Methanomethylophilaceae archaeon]